MSNIVGAAEYKKRKAKTRRLLKAFEETVNNLASKGAAPPEDRQLIQAKYEHARKLLLQHIDEG